MVTPALGYALRFPPKLPPASPSPRWTSLRDPARLTAETAALAWVRVGLPPGEIGAPG